MQTGEVVVMDIGALYRGYSADVTRTVPVNGRFTPEQRARRRSAARHRRWTTRRAPCWPPAWRDSA
jgi:Xaa-Pro aminopeptidase